MRQHVYFIQRGIDGPIKIGATSGDPRTRLAELQTASPETLYLIGCFRGTEADMHEKFLAHRIAGEWFTAHDDIIVFVKLNTRKKAPRGGRGKDDLIYFRATSALRAALEQERDRRSELVGGTKVTLSAVIRSILEQALRTTDKRKRVAA